MTQILKEIRLSAAVWVLAIFAVFALPRRAEAMGQDNVWILSGGTSAGLNLQTGTPQTKTYDIKLAIGHSLMDSFELVLMGNYISLSTEGFAPSSLLEFDGQLNWIITGDHSEAFYIGPRIGSQSNDRNNVKTSVLIVGGALGKRFGLGGMVSFDPEVAMTMVDDSGTISTPAFNITPIQFTLIF